MTQLELPLEWPKQETYVQMDLFDLSPYDNKAQQIDPDNFKVTEFFSTSMLRRRIGTFVRVQ